jgi:Holliday junction resolvase
MYKNPLDVAGKCSVEGAKAEDVFANILREEGYEVERSSFQDQLRHIDLYATKNGQTFSVDVKARKRLRREDNNAQDELIWVECLSVSGKLGWAFSSVNYIVFEREKDFVMVPQKKLASFVKQNCDLKKIAHHPVQALYKKYERPGRKDCLTLIKGTDIEKMAKKIYLKSR